jgi:GntR family transcriptional regulator
MSIDLGSSIPVYQQIADSIRRSIAAGVYRPGEMTPSLRALALELTVNPNTVQRAFETLEREGLIYSRKGLGMFVTTHGARSAQDRSRVAVYETFAHGIRAGFEANMPNEQIRRTFKRAFDDVDANSRIRQ